MHHTTLKAAVTKYKPLMADGKPEQEVKAEIAKDEKKYDQEAVNEIYAALTASGAEEDPVYEVSHPFRDVHNFDLVHEIGTDLSHLEKSDKQRFDFLVAQGYLVKKAQ